MLILLLYCSYFSQQQKQLSSSAAIGAAKDDNNVGDLQEDSFVPLEICQEKRHYFMLYSCFFSTDNTQSNTYPYALEYSAWFSQVKMINELSAQILSHNVQGMSLV